MEIRRATEGAKAEGGISIVGRSRNYWLTNSGAGKRIQTASTAVDVARCKLPPSNGRGWRNTAKADVWSSRACWRGVGSGVVFYDKWSWVQGGVRRCATQFGVVIYALTGGQI